jgi:predicted  nucleic acid-binding Zn-ribbon protein
MSHRIAFSTTLVAVAGLITLHAVSAQQPAASGDLNAALLAEVRGLRAAMEQLASAGPRIQLAMGRLQLQEQRVNTLIRRDDALREQIASKENERLELRDQLARFENALSAETDPDKREHLQRQGDGFKSALERLTADIQRLRADESEAANALAVEQGRWTEINARLEALDRALGK